MNTQIFRAYDIRGVADRDLTNEVAFAIGWAYATMVAAHRGKAPSATTICLGRDCRLSSDRLYTNFLGGVRAVGVAVVDIGVVATPELYWSVFARAADGGVQITGSHNPADQNGFKMMLGQGTLHGDKIEALRDLIACDVATWMAAFRAPHDLRATPWPELRAAYVADIAARLRIGARMPKVVLDAGSGAGGPAGQALLEMLGVPHIALYTAMDGRFPHHHPDPTVEANLVDLIRTVRAERADIGIAFAGDADRIGVVDHTGKLLWGDRLLVVLARDVLSRNPGAAVVGEVKCSKTLFAEIAKAGGRPIMSAVGHSIIKDRMKKEGALLAGEMSGHIFYAERWYGFDDAIHVMARLIEILSHTGASLAELLADVPETEVTPEIRLDCSDDKKFAIVAEAVAHYQAAHPVVDIDGARIDFGHGWGLIRASNTQPVIVLRAEAETAAGLAQIRAELEAFVAARG